jgi:hypothetical protein
MREWRWLWSVKKRRKTMVAFKEKLTALCAVIATECDARMRSNGKFGVKEVAEWFVQHKRPIVIEGLTDLIHHVMEQENDNDTVERVLRARPELRKRERALRLVSGTLDVPLWYLLDRLDDERVSQCCLAARLIVRLQAEESKARLDAWEAAEELIHPVTDGHPEMTEEEAMRELKQKTDETIRGLESTGP